MSWSRFLLEMLLELLAWLYYYSQYSTNNQRQVWLLHSWGYPWSVSLPSSQSMLTSVHNPVPPPLPSLVSTSNWPCVQTASPSQNWNHSIQHCVKTKLVIWVSQTPLQCYLQIWNHRHHRWTCLTETASCHDWFSSRAHQLIQDLGCDWNSLARETFHQSWNLVPFHHSLRSPQSSSALHCYYQCPITLVGHSLHFTDSWSWLCWSLAYLHAMCQTWSQNHRSPPRITHHQS